MGSKKQILLDACYNVSIEEVNSLLSEENLDITGIFREISKKCFADVKPSKEHLQLTELLVDHGANMNAVNEGGYALVHYACMYPDAETPLLPKLISLGADVNIQCEKSGFTPLHICSRHNYIKNGSEVYADNVNRLLAAKANVCLRDRKGKTALHHLVESNHCDLVEKLAKKMLDRGVDVNARDSHNATPLHLSHFTQSFRGNIIIAAWDEFLIIHGANANIRDLTYDKEIPMERRFNGCMFFQGIHLFSQLAPRGAQTVFPWSLKRTLLLSLKSGLNLKCFSKDLLRSVITELFKCTNFHLILALIEAEGGTRVKIKKWTKHGFEPQEAMFLTLLQGYELTLTRYAANVIRTSLQPNALLGIDHLCLPKSLKEYILLEEFPF